MGTKQEVMTLAGAPWGSAVTPYYPLSGSAAVVETVTELVRGRGGEGISVVHRVSLNISEPGAAPPSPS